MSILDKIANAQATGGGNWIMDGDYRFIVERISLHDGFEGTSFIAELYVKESKGVLKDVEPNSPGTTCSFVQNLTKHASAPGNVKAFMLSVLKPLGYGEADFNAQVLEEAKSDAQPLRGVEVADTTFQGKIRSGKNAGQAITKHKWSSVDQTPEEIKAARAFLDDRLKGNKPETKTEAPARSSLLGKLK